MVIAVDLDGTLAEFGEWQGRDKIGDPLPGAVQAMWTLVSSGHNVFVYTCRCSHELHAEYTEGHTVGESAAFVLAWLRRHRFPHMQVYVGQGKPIADVYLDDRAMRVAPMHDPGAWGLALAAIQRLARTTQDPEGDE